MATTKKSKVQKRADKAEVVKRKTVSKVKLRSAKSSKKLEGINRPKQKPEGVAPSAARITANKGPVKSIASRTLFAPKENNDRSWLIIDAKDKTVGRLASEIAILLRGKHKVTFTPHSDAGDFVVVINAKDVRFTRGKEEQKNYYKHSGWVGGMKVKNVARVRKEHPERILENAVKGMISRNVLGRAQMKKLKIYADDKHPHAAQQPKVWELRYHNRA